MSSLKEQFPTLIEKEGVLYATSNAEISYPEDGNEGCFSFEEDSFWFKHRNNCIYEVVKSYAPNKTFYDVGGGNGFVAKHLENNGIDSVLVEPGVKGCLNAKSRALKNIICATLENATFTKGSLPAVGLFDVVEHIEKDLVFLQEVNQYLEKGGMVFITVPAYRFLWSTEDDDAGHFRRYTTGQLKRKLVKAGFDITYSGYIFSFLPLPVFLTRTLPSWLGLNKNAKDLGKHKKAHQTSGGIVDRLSEKILNWEVKRVKKGKSVFMGGSCLLVAKKK